MTDGASSRNTLVQASVDEVQSGEFVQLMLNYRLLIQYRIPSVFWQFLWAAVFGPWILLRIREIRDTHYWAWQTRLAVIAWYNLSALVGTPDANAHPVFPALHYGSHSYMHRALSWIRLIYGSLHQAGEQDRKPSPFLH